MRVIFGGTVLLLVSLDAAGSMVVLCVGLCAAEDGDNCSWFLELAFQHFSGLDIVMTDQGKAIT